MGWLCIAESVYTGDNMSLDANENQSVMALLDNRII
jgi:hypothetical protein